MNNLLDICRLFPGIPMNVANQDGTLSPLHKPESDDLAQSIAAATDAALHDVGTWLSALREDVAYNDAPMRHLLRLAMKGDEAQFGTLLTHAIRRQVIHNATEDARSEYEEAHEGEQA